MSAALKQEIVERHALDRLTCLHPTADDLRYRATFWRKYLADQPTAIGGIPGDYAAWINCDEMVVRADEMDLPAPIIALVPVAKKASARKAATVGAEEFWSLHSLAVRAIVAKHGSDWKVRAPEDTFSCTLPAKLCSYVGPKGGKIRWRRDHVMPTACYWPGGVLPVGCEIASAGKPVSEWRTNGIVEWTWLARAEQIEADQARHFRPEYPRMLG